MENLEGDFTEVQRLGNSVEEAGCLISTVATVLNNVHMDVDIHYQQQEEFYHANSDAHDFLYAKNVEDIDNVKQQDVASFSASVVNIIPNDVIQNQGIAHIGGKKESQQTCSDDGDVNHVLLQVPIDVVINSQRVMLDAYVSNAMQEHGSISAVGKQELILDNAAHLRCDFKMRDLDVLQQNVYVVANDERNNVFEQPIANEIERIDRCVIDHMEMGGIRQNDSSWADDAEVHLEDWHTQKRKIMKIKDKPGDKVNVHPVDKRFTRSSLIEVSTACGVRVEGDDIIHVCQEDQQNLNASNLLFSLSNFNSFDSLYVKDYEEGGVFTDFIEHHSDSKNTYSKQELYIPPHIKNRRKSWGAELDMQFVDSSEGSKKAASKSAKKAFLLPRLTESSVSGCRKSHR